MYEPNMWAAQLPGIVFTIVAAAFYLIVRHQNLQRYRIRLELIQKERLIAMEKGIPMPELPDYDDTTKPSAVASVIAQMRVNPKWPLGVGAILIFGGIGTTIALRLSQEAYHYRVWSMGLIPIAVGFGLFAHYALTRAHDR
jgi:hypothetical protein